MLKSLTTKRGRHHRWPQLHNINWKATCTYTGFHVLRRGVHHEAMHQTAAKLLGKLGTVRMCRTPDLIHMGTQSVRTEK